MAKFTLQQYCQAAQRTSPDDGHDKTDNAMFGLIGETGEIADLYKKWKYQSTPDTQMPRARFLDEIGDVLWYLVELAEGMEISLKEVMNAEAFDEIDNYLLQRSNHMRNCDARHMILAMASHANEICNFAGRGEKKRVKAHMRKMIIAAGGMAMECGGSVEKAARGNIEKLKRRYPAGFDAKISMGRYE